VTRRCTLPYMLSPMEVTGRVRTHITQIATPRFAAQPDAAAAFLDLRSAAAREGFDIEPFSAFRDYKTQLRIWNHKFSGKKPLYTKEGEPRDFSQLNEEQIVRHILDWSALPGASRHQWGTEIDVIDRAAVVEGYVPQLLPQETTLGGVFHPLHLWLDQNIADYDFFRPYKRYQGGMFEEPWHLSYAPGSLSAIEALSVDLLVSVTEEAEILGKEVLMDIIPDIYKNHVLNFVGPDDQ